MSGGCRCNGGEYSCIYDLSQNFTTMREFIIKYFGRFMALLGCTTMVTACYGIPVDPETHWVEGLVKDAETGKPIKGIKVTLTPASDNGSTTGVQHIYVNESSREFYTSADGRIAQEITIYPYEETELFYLQCEDVDGSENGTYAPSDRLISTVEAGDFVVEMTPID